MDLANLGFVVDTKSIKDGISALRELQAAALGVTNSFKNVEGQASKSNKKATQEVDAHVLAYKKSLADKERISAKVEKAIESATQKRLDSEKTAGDGAVALFRTNELKKQKEAKATADAQEQIAKKKLDIEKTFGDQAVSLFRQNELKKQREAERLNKALELNVNKRLQLELTAGDQAVSLFRANEIKKQQSLQKTQDAHVIAFNKAKDAAQRYADTSLKAVQRQLQQVKIEAELAAQGLSRTTAVGVANLRGRGASEQDINTFIRTRKEIERITEESKKAGIATQGLSTILRQISPAVGAVGVVALFTQIGVAAIRAADQMTLLKSRMRLVLDETQDFTSTYDNLINTAVENRASLTDTVTLFVRLTPALRAAGLEASAANKVVDSFQKTLLISGATTRETSAAILQFSQAMAAGRLNGDEFRSISEAAPEFLRAFSKATGVATGALKELSAEGVLTTEVISAAMIVMNDELTKAAAGIEINLGQAIQILGTRLTESADRINTATGFTQALAETVFSLGETVKSVTDFIINNKDAFAGLASTLGTVLEVATLSLTIYAGIKGALLAVSLAGAGVTAVFTGLAGAASFAQLAIAKYTGTATTAAVATTGLGTAVKGLLSSTGIGAIAVVLGTAAVAFSDYIFSSDEAAETSKKVTEATEEETKAIEAARKILSDFGITYGSASGAAGEYAKKTRELTNAYIQQKVSAEGLYLIEKNLIELKRAQLVVEAAKIASSEKDTDTKNKEIAGVVKEIEAINELLGIMQLTEEVRAAKEAASKAATKATKSESAADKEASKIQKELEKIAKDRIKDYEKSIEEINKNTEAVLKEVAAIEEETARIGLSTEQIRLREIALLESAIATKEAELASKDFATSTFEEIDALEKFIEANKKKVDALKNQNKGLNDQQVIDDAKKASEATAKEFEKIQDDIAKSVGDAIISGGQKGKDILKNMFKAQIFRIFIEPSIRGGVSSVLGSLGIGSLSGLSEEGGQSSGFDIAGLANLAGQGFTGGIAGIALNKGLEQLALNPQVLENIGNSIFFNTTGALSEVGRSLATNASSLSSLAGEIAPFAGSIISLLQGDFRGAVGGAAGTALGGLAGSALSGAGFTTLGAIAGPLGAVLGATLGKKLFGGGKISATALSPEFGSGVKKTLEEQYLSIVRGLGGVAANVTFDAFGNTGRQGQNPNFTLGASVNGRNVFGSAQTAEGQADGLFLSGEIALTDVNLSDQSTRAIVAVLKETNFGPEVDALFDSVNAATDSIESLNDVLKQVDIVKFLNRNLTVFSSNIRNLITTSAEAFKQLVETSGGTEAFARALDLYVNTFATDTEKLANAQIVLKDSFNSLNLSVPETQKELRALIDAQDLTTEAGRRTYLSLINLIPVFKEVTDITSQFKLAQDNLSKAIEKNSQTISNSFEKLLQNMSLRTDTTSLRITSALEKINAKPVTDFVSTISNSKPTATVYREFINTVSKLQPTTGSYLKFVDAIEGFTPNTAAYRSFVDAVSGAKPKDVAYREFISSVSGLKPSSDLYKAFVDAVSKAKPSTQSFVEFTKDIQKNTEQVNSALDILSGQIELLNDTVVVVDFSAFTQQINRITTDISTLTTEIANTSDFGVRLQLEDQLQQAIISRYELEQQMLGQVFSTIQETLGSIKDERVAVREASIQILGGNKVLTPTEIRQRISSASALGSLPSLESEDVIREQSLLATKQAALSAIIAKQTTEVALKNAAISSAKEVVDGLLPSYSKELSDVKSAAARAIAVGNQFTTVGGRPSSEQFARFGIKTDPTTGVASKDNAYFVANTSDFNKQASEFFAVQNKYIAALNKLNSANRIAIKTTDAQIEQERQKVQLQIAEVEKAKTQAEQKFAEQLQKFVIDAGKATSQLGRLREETVRYFEEQQRLAGVLMESSKNIRQTISDIRFADLTPEQQLQSLQAQFASLFSQAKVLEGDALANAGNNLNNLINPILQKAQELYASSPEFQQIKEALLSQAEQIAQRIDSVTPVNYQQESLSLLDTIDSTLALIEENTKSAEQLIVDAIGSSADRTIAALSEIYRGITGTEIPAFAAGGYHFGGSALVGENGPEIVNMGSSRVFNASQTAQMLGGSRVDVTPVVEALNRVQERTEFQIAVLQEGFRRMDERQQAMQEELTDIRKNGALAD